jgi:hypothetical protein
MVASPCGAWTNRHNERLRHGDAKPRALGADDLRRSHSPLAKPGALEESSLMLRFNDHLLHTASAST